MEVDITYGALVAFRIGEKQRAILQDFVAVLGTCWHGGERIGVRPKEGLERAHSDGGEGAAPFLQTPSGL